MSKREELRKRRQSKARQQQLALAGLAVVLAVGVVGYLVYQDWQEANQPIGEVVSITKETYPFVDGAALGSAEAKVLVQEFSDFQ